MSTRKPETSYGDAVARAVCVRGLLAMQCDEVTFGGNVCDDFEELWESLPRDVQDGWIDLSAMLAEVVRSPGWMKAFSFAPLQGGSK